MRRQEDGGEDGGGKKRVGEHHDGRFGVYMSHKIQKLRGRNESFASAASPGTRREETDLFRGVHVYVDGYTVPSKEEIRQLMLLHGGGFEHYDTTQVTHIVATHLPASKLRQLQKAKKALPVVHPDWIVQSIEQSKLLPVQSFLYAGFSDPMQSSIVNLSTSTGNGTTNVASESASQQFDDEEDDASDEPDTPRASRSPCNSSSTLQLRTNSTRDGPDFVRHYFAKSRLHHIGTWRATFQRHALAFQAKYQGVALPRASPLSTDRVILHVDMDCFFVAVALRNNPELHHLPVAVAHSATAGSSEISSCNYVARAQGVSAGMLMQSAKAKCPELLVLPYHFSAIERVSCQIYAIFFTHTPFVQAISCDEAVLEFPSTINGVEKARSIRHEIHDQTQCVASVGVSYNLLLAKLAATKAKPDGISHIATASQAHDLLNSLKVRELPGVGRQTGRKLAARGVHNVNELLQQSKTELLQSLGQAAGETLFAFARGIDMRPLSMEANSRRTSVSAIVNFGIRFDKWDDATCFLMTLSDELSHRLRLLNVRTQCLTLLLKKRAKGAPVEPSKFMGHGKCETYSKSYTLAHATNDASVLGNIGIALLRNCAIPCQELRGVGMQATKLKSDETSRKFPREKLIQSWLKERTQDGERVASNTTNAKTNEGAVTSFSQINPEVLNELPPSLQQEILAAYGRGAPFTASRQAQGKRTTTGTARFRRKPPARNIFSSKSNDRLARQAHSSTIDNGDALNDLRMSQVDAEVYHALPWTIRREIDRYAQKRRPTSTVAPLPTLKAPANDTLKHLKSTRVLLPIEVLYTKLVETLPLATLADDKRRLSITRAHSAAFDAMYSRLLVEIEKRALDKAAQMLRFVRRKARSALPSENADVLQRDFNHLLTLVNEDIQRFFNGVLSSQVVARI